MLAGRVSKILHGEAAAAAAPAGPCGPALPTPTPPHGVAGCGQTGWALSGVWADGMWAQLHSASEAAVRPSGVVCASSLHSGGRAVSRDSAMWAQEAAVCQIPRFFLY